VRKILGLAVIGFCVGLAAIVGYRMSDEAMAVVIGVVCGVLASIPMSALILVITQRQRQQSQESRWAQQRNSPPVVVIQGGTAMQRPELPLYQQPPMPMMSSAPREFRVIGEEWMSDDRGR